MTKKSNYFELATDETKGRDPVEKPLGMDGMDDAMDDDSPKDGDILEDDEDGGAVIHLDDHRPASSSEFYANLAEDLPETLLSKIAADLCDLIENDKESRKKRDEQYEEGIRRTGLGDEAPGGAQFMGASRVVHPMLTEACVDFAARAMKEIFPANGPAKMYIPGDDPTDMDIERSERIAAFLNYQAMVQIPEMRSELEQMATQLPLGGGQYIKCNWDAKKGRPSVLFISIDDVYLPFAATNFYTAERKTHVQTLTKMEFKSRIKTGMYRNLEVLSTLLPEFSKSEEASNKIEGREPSGFNEDGLRTIYECFCYYDGVEEKEDEALPYIISIDKNSKKILSIYRNWDEDDKKRLELDWIVEFSFIPWRGAYPIGLTHMIGSLSGAATGALRALLDSALINNFPGLLKLKGGSAGGQTERVEPTQVIEIEGAIQDDDVRKLVMPMPFNPPSPVLFELLNFLVNSGKQLVRTSLDETADTSADVPVGTTLARLEQGMMVYSAIHGRMHDSMGKLLKILYRIDRDNLTEKEVYNEVGKLLIKREDFEGPMTVVPVSDPNIFSESQRFAQIQLIAQRAQALPQLYDMRKVEELILERMKIPNVEQLLLPKQQGEETNAINENIAASMGRPVVAFPEQDHLAHLQAHTEFMTNPMLGMSQMIAPKALPILLEHIKEHMVLWYANQIFDVASQAAQIEISELQRKATVEERQAFDRMLAEASGVVSPNVEQTFSQVPQIFAKCQELLQKMQPQQPDPASQLGMAEIQSREKIEGQKIQVEQQRLQQDAQTKQMEFAHAKEIENLKGMLKEQEMQFKGQIEEAKIAAAAAETRAKLAEQSRQADQVMTMESMKQEHEDMRTAAQLDTTLTIEEMKVGSTESLAATRAEQDALARQEGHSHENDMKATDIALSALEEAKKEEQMKADQEAKEAKKAGMAKGGKVKKPAKPRKPKA